jgi:hypothetical protein
MPYWGIASGVLSIFIVSADRCLVNLDGSGSPVKGATGPTFNVDVVVVTEVVVVDVSPNVVVVVESAKARETIIELAPIAIATVDTRIFFIESNYRVNAPLRTCREPDDRVLLAADGFTILGWWWRPDAD